MASGDPNQLGESSSKNGGQPASSRVQEFSRAFPIAIVHRLMKTILPKHAKISEKSKEAMVECAAEFISFVTAEANHYCKLESRTTITAEDLLNTLAKLGFEVYAKYSFRYIQLFRRSAQVRQYGPPPPPPSAPQAFHACVGQYAPPPPPPPAPQAFQAHDFPLDPNFVFPDPTEMDAIFGDDFQLDPNFVFPDPMEMGALFGDDFPLDPNFVFPNPTEMGAILGDDDDDARELGAGVGGGGDGGDGNASDGSFDLIASLNGDD